MKISASTRFLDGSTIPFIYRPDPSTECPGKLIDVSWFLPLLPSRYRRLSSTAFKLILGGLHLEQCTIDRRRSCILRWRRNWNCHRQIAFLCFVYSGLSFLPFCFGIFVNIEVVHISDGGWFSIRLFGFVEGILFRLGFVELFVRNLLLSGICLFQLFFNFELHTFPLITLSGWTLLREV